MFQMLPGAERVCGQRGSEGGGEEKRVGRSGIHSERNENLRQAGLGAKE